MTIIRTNSDFDDDFSCKNKHCIMCELHIKQVKYFLEANNIKDKKEHRIMLLAMCDMKTLSILKSFVNPNKSSEIIFTNTETILSDHFFNRKLRNYIDSLNFFKEHSVIGKV